jgi:hypothetical protein
MAQDARLDALLTAVSRAQATAAESWERLTVVQGDYLRARQASQQADDAAAARTVELAAYQRGLATPPPTPAPIPFCSAWALVDVTDHRRVSGVYFGTRDQAMEACLYREEMTASELTWYGWTLIPVEIREVEGQV